MILRNMANTLGAGASFATLIAVDGDNVTITPTAPKQKDPNSFTVGATTPAKDGQGNPVSAATTFEGGELKMVLTAKNGNVVSLTRSITGDGVMTFVMNTGDVKCTRTM